MVRCVYARRGYVLVDLTKQGLFKIGHTLVHNFCCLNSLPTPKIQVVSGKDWRFGPCGYYREDIGITIRLERCAAVGRGGASWSWPGYCIDRTPYGVLAHELGHCADLATGEGKGKYS